MDLNQKYYLCSPVSDGKQRARTCARVHLILIPILSYLQNFQLRTGRFTELFTTNSYGIELHMDLNQKYFLCSPVSDGKQRARTCARGHLILIPILSYLQNFRLRTGRVTKLFTTNSYSIELPTYKLY